MALTADLEIFLDTLRSMEPPEILRTHRLPRAPRSSYLAMYATLPAIEEDQPGPCVLGPSPQEVPALEVKKEEKAQEEEEEEPENPYLSDDEKLQRRQERARLGPPRDPSPACAGAFHRLLLSSGDDEEACSRCQGPPPRTWARVAGRQPAHFPSWRQPPLWGSGACPEGGPHLGTTGHKTIRSAAPQGTGAQEGSRTAAPALQ